MGVWGMGITQSDSFCEVYDAFMERYNEGESTAAITADIVAAYRKDFDDGDPILHDVFFALAKAEWMCAAQSAPLVEKVTQIITSGANLAFYSQLGASAADLKLRQRSLEKFLEKLQTPRPSAKKRTPAPKNQTATAEKGLVFWYRSQNSVYGALVLDIVKRDWILLALSQPLCSVPQSADEVLAAPAYTVVWATALLPSNRTHRLGTVAVHGSCNGRGGLLINDHLTFCENLISDAVWAHEKRCIPFCATPIAHLLQAENVPASFANQERLDWLIQKKMRAMVITGRDSCE